MLGEMRNAIYIMVRKPWKVITWET